jgi:hypothetical protein
VSNAGDCTTAFPCALGAIPAGESRTITAVFLLPSSYLGPDPIENVATVSGTVPDPETINNSATATVSLPGTDFYTVTPCRVIDTRITGGPLGSGEDRLVTLAGACGVPTTARAVSYNVAVTAPTFAGNLRLYPAGTAVPVVSTVNFAAGQTRANNGVIQLGEAGQVAVRAQLAGAGTVQFIIDVTGYFE